MNLSSKGHYPVGPYRQQGMVAVVLSTLLLIAVSLILLSSGKTAVMEQRISANELHAMEVAQAAEAALEYGQSWFDNNLPTWPDTQTSGSCPNANYPGLDEVSQPVIASPPLQVTYPGGNYTLDIHYCRYSRTRRKVLITATATSTADDSITSSASVYTEIVSADTTPYFSFAPLILSGCLSGTVGTPDVFPAFPTDVSYETAEPAPAVGCTRPGFNEGLNLNGGVAVADAFAGPDAWSYVFNYDRAEFQTRAAAETGPISSRRYVYVTSSANFHDNIGSPTQPAILVFAPSADCPKINGNPTIYGIVFVDSGCTGGAHGWGGTSFYGSVIINGSATHLNANVEFHHWSKPPSPGLQNATPRIDLASDSAPRLIGTWRDF